MKRIYFAGKFKLDPNTELPLGKRLEGDFRAVLLGGGERLAVASDDVMLTDDISYAGPFYCEAASSGEYTSLDCMEVLAAERRAVLGCDVYVAVFDESFSVGTVVELGWALNCEKEIFIIYKKEPSRYKIASEYWFAIADAISRNDRVSVFACDGDSEIQSIIEREIIGKEK